MSSVMTRAFVLSTGLVLAAAILFPATAVPAAPQDGEAPTLESHMIALKRCQRLLRRSLADAAGRDESLRLVTEMQARGLAAKSMVPSRAATLPEEQRAGFLGSYRRRMLDFIDRLLDLEREILEGRLAAAADVQKSLDEFMEAAHREFRVEEKKQQD